MKGLITTMAVALVAATAVRADTLAFWDNGGMPVNQATAPVDVVHAGMSSTSLSAGAGLNTNPSWPDSLASYAHTLKGSLGEAITANHYFTFTLTPDAGKTVSYDNIFTRVSLNTGDTNVGATIEFFLLSDQTGFTASDSLDSFSATRSPGSSGAAYVPGTFDVSGVSGLQNLAVATEFRIYAVETAGVANRMGIGEAWGGNTHSDDLVVNGTVIPEPATLGLLCFFSAGLLWIRRKFAI
jgi:hypothetical protein